MPKPVIIPDGPLQATDADIARAEGMVAALAQIFKSGTVGGSAITEPFLIPDTSRSDIDPALRHPVPVIIDTVDKQHYYRQLAHAMALSLVRLASASVAGVTKLSSDPSSPCNPVALNAEEVSTTPGPNKVPRAGPTGVLDPGWVTGGGPSPVIDCAFAATCLATDVVGDLVRISGPGKHVTKVNPLFAEQMPAIGIIVSKSSSTECMVQVSDLVANVVSGLTPGQVYYVGADGRLSSTPLVAPYISQPCGIAIDTNLFLVNMGDGATTAPSGGGGWIIINDVEPDGSGVVDAKTYQDAGSTVLQSCTSSTTTVLVTVRASSPLVTVGGVSATLQRAADTGHYTGSVPVTLAAPGPVVAVVTLPDGEDGAKDTVNVALDLPPELLTLSFIGVYPGSQTELKAGDTFLLTGTTDKPANAVEVMDFGAGVSQVLTFPTGTTFTVSMTVANRGTVAQLLPARARARNPGGAFGGTRDTNASGGTVERVNLVKLNNLRPTVLFGSPAYPAGQGALKGSEQSTVPVTLANLDSVSFTSPGNQLSIAGPTVIEAVKTVTRLSGTYNVSTTNLMATAYRNANGSQTSAYTTVKIAAIAPAISVTTPATRLRSGGNDGTAAQNYTITITSDQALSGPPTLEADKGTFINSWSGGPTVWTRTLRVTDNDPKGTFSWLTPSATNLAGLTANVITSGATYTLGGFVARNVTFGNFKQYALINVAVVTYAKLTASYFTATNQPAVLHSVQGDHGDAPNQFTVDSMGTNPTTVWWNDVAAASSNTGGTAQLVQLQELA